MFVRALVSVSRRGARPSWTAVAISSACRGAVPAASAIGCGARTLCTDVGQPPAETGRRVEETKDALLRANAVMFDVDSTVIMEEAIVELADFKGVRQAVDDWTTKAMSDKSVSFREALKARLDIMQVHRDDVPRVMRERPFKLSPRVAEFIGQLHERGTHVYLVSGGFTALIGPVAKAVGVPMHRVYANNILFDEATGEYAGFDKTAPTSESGGKARVAAALKREHGYKVIVMVGDGITDSEARDGVKGEDVGPRADFFIGYGGVVVRDSVVEAADWYVHSFDTLCDLVAEADESSGSEHVDF